MCIRDSRIGECLAWRTYLYVDDLVTDADSRSKCYGDKIFDWLVDFAKTNQRLQRFIPFERTRGGAVEITPCHARRFCEVLSSLPWQRMTLHTRSAVRLW